MHFCWTSHFLPRHFADVQCLCNFHSLLLARFSSSFVSWMLKNDSCPSGKSFPPITSVWYYRQQCPLGSWQLIPPGDLQRHLRAFASGGLPKGKLLQCQFQPSSDFCFISSQVTAVKLKRYSNLTTEFCFSLLVHLQFDWCDMFFLHDWISMVGDGHL